jgi:DNA polymerase-3 subunit delta
VYTPQLPPPWKEDAWLVLIQEEITASCGLTVSSQVAHWLLSHVGPTLGEIVQRVQTARLLMAEGDSHLTLDHLQALIPRSYYQTFELVDSWIRYHFSVRPSSEASLAWASLIAYVKQEPALKLMALFRHRLQELYGIVLDKSHGLSEETIGQKIGKHPFIIKKTLQQFQNTTHEGLQALLHHLVSLEWQAKEGILTPELALEVFLAQRPAANCTLLKESIFTWEQAYHVMPTEAFKIQPSL